MKRNIILAEFIGTFALVFFGCGAVAVSSSHGGVPGHTGISLVFGLTVMAMIYSTGNISGAHINPAVTLGFLFAGRLRGKTVLPYVISQLAGSLAAAYLLKILFGGSDLGVTLPTGSVLQAFIMETVLSFLLMCVILNVSSGHKEKGIMAGAAIGGTVALMALMGGPVSGASMNPARSFGPALASGIYQHLWIYILAPVLGMLMASPTCRWIQGRECCHLNREKFCDE